MSTQKRMNCAVFGLGRLGSQHAANLAGRVAGAKLAGVADPVKEARERFTAQFSGIDAAADYRELLERRDIDAVVIATATNTHVGIIVDALDAGKAVFCEKPVTLDLSEAAKVRDALDKTKGFLMVGFMRRFDDAYMYGKKQIDSGTLGEPVYVNCVGRDPAAPPIEYAKVSGGLVLDMSIHDIDLARWFLGGDVKRVVAQGGVLMCEELKPIGDIDHINILFEYRNGRLAQLEASRNARYGYDIRTEVICTKGAVFIGDMRQTHTVVLNKNGMMSDTVPEFRTRFDKAYLNEIERFIVDVAAGKEPSPNIDDGVAAVELSFAANKALSTKMPVDV
ncbi:MAG: Gfo/Idh/MocA family oxidoreductase [Treponema sp.]|jgi:scyllo-inositol 2-dehydrogenase (NAD+)|nr:Gfo/Idh/MocA family oxidoreductase [Treponema sp.]